MDGSDGPTSFYSVTTSINCIFSLQELYFFFFMSCVFVTGEKFSKMARYDVSGVGINLREIPDENGAIKLKVLGIILDGPAHTAGVRQVLLDLMHPLPKSDNFFKPHSSLYLSDLLFWIT